MLEKQHKRWLNSLLDMSRPDTNTGVRNVGVNASKEAHSIRKVKEQAGLVRRKKSFSFKSMQRHSHRGSSSHANPSSWEPSLFGSRKTNSKTREGHGLRQEARDRGTVRGMDEWVPYRKETDLVKLFKIFYSFTNLYTTMTHAYKKEIRDCACNARRHFDCEQKERPLRSLTCDRNNFLVTLGDNPDECSIPVYLGEGRVRWCNEVRHEENGIKQNGRWRQTQIQRPGIDIWTLRTLNQPSSTRMKTAGALKLSCFTHKEPNSLGYKRTWSQMHTRKKTSTHETSAPTVCPEWNQWVPKGSGMDFYVNFLCLKVKWGKGRHTEGNLKEGRRTEQRGMEERVWERNRQVSWHQNVARSPLTKKLASKGLFFKENMHDVVSTPLVTMRL